MSNGLIYIGRGAFQYPYPARDLSANEVKEFGREKLLATGLYQEETPTVLRTSTPNRESSDLGEKKKEKENK
jgi:hypothetical protein